MYRCDLLMIIAKTKPIVTPEPVKLAKADKVPFVMTWRNGSPLRALQCSRTNIALRLVKESGKRTAEWIPKPENQP